jgi:hypothetical protein
LIHMKGFWRWLRGEVPDYSGAHPSEFDHYRQWCQEQACVDCGARYADRQRDEKGVCIDMWVTEQQCWECYKKHGSPESRGMPGVAKTYDGNVAKLRAGA